MLSTIDCACWKYHIEDNGMVSASLRPLVDSWGIGKIHTHVGLFDFSDTIAVVQIDIDSIGNWVWSNTTPFWPMQSERARYEFVAQKQFIRTDSREPFNEIEQGCSHKKIVRSFSHVIRGFDLFNPNRDGWPKD